MHLLVIRTSAMGDVALTAPVISALRKKNPGISITLVTQKPFTAFFDSISGLEVFTVDFKGRHKGYLGTFRLFRDLKKLGKIDHLIDLHDVLRTKILRLLFRLSGIPAWVIDKGRSEKKEIIKGKRRTSLKHTVERYCDTFGKAGFKIIPDSEISILPSGEPPERISLLPLISNVMNIGVAPYTRHSLKMWPEKNMVTLLKLISGKHNVKYWLFGGTEDAENLNRLHNSLPGSYLVAGNLKLGEELALMKRLDFMISMDSSNMHMAALCGTRVISIWGATDPVAGFGPWMQPDERAIRIPAEELTCRPCTIYGKGKCRRGDFACMIWLTPDKVYDMIINLGII